MTAQFKPMKDKIFVTDMDSGVHKTSGGIIILDDNGKPEGIRPRWAKVAFLGSKIDYLEVGEWVLVEHGRWTQKIIVEHNGESIAVWMIEDSAILVVADKNYSHEKLALS